MTEAEKPENQTSQSEAEQLPQLSEKSQVRINDLLDRISELVGNAQLGKIEKNLKTTELLKKVKVLASGEEIANELTENEAKEVLGDRFIGSDEIKEILGIKGEIEIPPLEIGDYIPVTKEMLEWAEKKGLTLILRLAEADQGEPLTQNLLIGISSSPRVTSKLSDLGLTEGVLINQRTFDHSPASGKDRVLFTRSHWAFVSFDPLYDSVTPQEYDIDEDGHSVKEYVDIQGQVRELNKFIEDFTSKFEIQPPKKINDNLKYLRNPSECLYDWFIYNLSKRDYDSNRYGMRVYPDEIIDWKITQEADIDHLYSDYKLLTFSSYQQESNDVPFSYFKGGEVNDDSRKFENSGFYPVIK